MNLKFICLNQAFSTVFRLQCFIKINGFDRAFGKGNIRNRSSESVMLIFILVNVNLDSINWCAKISCPLGPKSYPANRTALSSTLDTVKEVYVKAPTLGKG